MASRKFKPKRRPPSFRPKRTDIRRALWLIPVLGVAGALLDPSLIGPIGPLASPPELVSTRFTPCGPGRGPACVVDGDTFRIGKRRVRIIGIDAPETHPARCPEEARLGELATARLQDLLNQGPFEMIAPAYGDHAKYGRELRTIQRKQADGSYQSIASEMRGSGLAHRYIGFKTGWC